MRLPAALQSLVNRLASPTALTGWGGSGWVSDPLTNPQDRLGDPLANLTEATLESYRLALARGETALPLWALENAIRSTPMLANYARLWTASLSGLDWSIRVAAESDPTAAEAQAAVLRKTYDRLDVPGLVAALARASIFGHAGVARGEGGTLDPLDPWNIARDGLRGAWYWNPNADTCRTGLLPEEQKIDAADAFVHVVADACAVEWLRIYLRVKTVERAWDMNLESESKRQVVILMGRPPQDQRAAAETAAKRIAEGSSGWLPKGPADQSTEVLFPPASRGLPFYEARLRLLDEWACKTLFGAPLVALSAPDSGTLAGNAHQDTARQRLRGAARSIAATLQREVDLPALTAAGLAVPGARPLAYFELRTEADSDPEAEVRRTTQLAAAGYRRDVAELSEATGMTLTESQASAQSDTLRSLYPVYAAGYRPTEVDLERLVRMNLEPTPAAPGDGSPLSEAAPTPTPNRTPDARLGIFNRLRNRKPAEAIAALSEAVAVRDLRAWDAPLRAWLDKLAASIGTGDVTPETLSAVESAIESLTEDDIGDADALATFLERVMAGAVVEGAKAAAKAAKE